MGKGVKGERWSMKGERWIYLEFFCMVRIDKVLVGVDICVVLCIVCLLAKETHMVTVRDQIPTHRAMPMEIIRFWCVALWGLSKPLLLKGVLSSHGLDHHPVFCHLKLNKLEERRKNEQTAEKARSNHWKKLKRDKFSFPRMCRSG